MFRSLDFLKHKPSIEKAVNEPADNTEKNYGEQIAYNVLERVGQFFVFKSNYCRLNDEKQRDCTHEGDWPDKNCRKRLTENFQLSIHKYVEKKMNEWGKNIQ